MIENSLFLFEIEKKNLIIGFRTFYCNHVIQLNYEVWQVIYTAPFRDRFLFFYFG